MKNSVVLPLGIALGLAACRTPPEAVVPRVRFCTLSETAIAQATRELTIEMAEKGMAGYVGALQAGDGARPVALSAVDCDELALRFAERQQLPLSPTVAFRFGAGYLLYQPANGGSTLLVVSPSLEMLTRVTSFT